MVERFRQPMNLLIGAVPGKPPMVPTGVVGVIAVGVDGSVVRSAKATVPFLARFTGHGVESGDGNPSINRFKVAVPLPQWFVAVSVIVKPPGSVGEPVMFPLVVFMDKPAGRKLAPKLSGLWFVLNRREHGTPVAKVTFVTCGVKFGAQLLSTNIISLLSEGYLGAILRVGGAGRPGRVGQSKLA